MECTSRSAEDLKICIHIVLDAGQRKQIENSDIWIFKSNKKIINIRAISYNYKMADWMETGFSFNNRVKRAENAPGCHHAQNFYLILNILS